VGRTLGHDTPARRIVELRELESSESDSRSGAN
jgi:hypothetical protein